MRFYLILAWRNLWRNKKRSFICLLSIILALILALFMRSLQRGAYGNMIKGGVRQVGYLQVHDSSYWENKSINYSFVFSKSLRKKVLETRNVNFILPRLESFSLISYGVHTKGVPVICSPPKEESSFSQLENRLVKGEYLNDNDDGILIGEGLSGFLNAIVGDTVVLLGQGYQGVSSADKFVVRGIVRWPSNQLNNSFVFMTLDRGRSFFSPYVPNLVSSLSLLLQKPKQIQETKIELIKELGSDYEIMSWDEMLKEMVQEIQADNAGGKIMLGILYLVIGFGIFGTVMMMTFERKHEMGILLAIGMRKYRMLIVHFSELILLAIIGVLIGIVVSLPFLFYLNKHPLPLPADLGKLVAAYNLDPFLPFSIDPWIFINQAIVVFALTLICAIYPLVVIIRLKILQSLTY
ncbi:MAG: ABC transporter permease [Bacteroidales bacterium]